MFYFAAIFKIIFLSLYASITLDECYAWFHLNTASKAARNTEQLNITNNYSWKDSNPHTTKTSL